MNDRSGFVAGIDLGGTATRIAIVEASSGELVASQTVMTETFVEASYGATLDRLVTALLEVAGNAGALTSLGVGASGPIDMANGVIMNPDTLPGFSGFPLATELISRLHVPVFLDNDSACAALGEFTTGSGVGSRRLLMVTLGTGVGVALIEDGTPYRGVDGHHPEAGHIGVGRSAEHCYCGALGCWEQMASRTALERSASTVLPSDVEPVGRLKWLAEHADANSRVQDLIAEYGADVGRGLLVLAVAYAPDRIVLGGSVAKLLHFFRDSMMTSLRRNGAFALDIPIVESALGNLAGALGAAMMARQDV